MDTGKVSNLMADRATRSYHPCTRCVAYFATGEYRFAGKIGCCFPTVTDANSSLFRSWLFEAEAGNDVQAVRCWRCFLTNSDCFAVCGVTLSQNGLH